MQGKGLIAAVVAVVVIVLAIGALWLLPENEPRRTASQRSEPPAMADRNDGTSSGSPDIEAPSRAEPPAPPSEPTRTEAEPAEEPSATAADKPAVSESDDVGERQSEEPADGESAQTAKQPDPGGRTEVAGSAPAETVQSEETAKTTTGDQPVVVTEDRNQTGSGQSNVAATPTEAPASEPSRAAQPETTAQTEEPGAQESADEEQQVAVVTPPKQPVPSAQPAVVPPSFDLVRISQQCTAVIAGRAEPGAQVTVWDGDRPLGQVEADRRGEWVLVVGEPMRSGSRQLKLVAVGASDTPVESDSVVVITVPDCSAPQPDTETEKDSVIAVLTPKEGGTSQVLQAPESEDETESPKGLSLKSVDYDEKGEVVLSGKAEPGQNVQAYVDNKPVGAARADAEGRWEVKPDETIEPGVHKLRVDQVEEGGKVAARVELPFSRASAEQVVLAPGRVIVQPGNSLWRIARRTYGHGLRYTVIYQANQDQIRDPDLIYPGQIFSLPRDNTQVN